MYRKMNKEGERIDIDFGESPEVMRSRYMDIYDEVKRGGAKGRRKLSYY